MSFARHLAGLDAERLARLFEHRPDVLIEPVPRGFAQLAQRLNGPDSLSLALRSIDRDLLLTAQAVAMVGDLATALAVAALLGVRDELVTAAVSGLSARGLAWTSAGTIVLPDRLAAHFAAEIGEFRPIASIATQVVVDDLRLAVAGLGGDPSGLRKPELVARLGALMADPAVVGAAIAGLSSAARTRLDQMRRGDYYVSYRPPGGSDPREALIRAGLLVRLYGGGQLPREVAVAALLGARTATLSGPPELPPAEVSVEAARRSAQAAAEGVLVGLTTLLDEAQATPITALKKGGVGTRERTRLAKRLSIDEHDLVLWIDIAAAAGLLERTDRGYEPTTAYARWREEGPSLRWVRAVRAWFGLDWAPTHRDTDGHGEVPPPVPMLSGAGLLRRALLRAVASGRSVRAAGTVIDWFCPLSGYPPEHVPEKVAATVREGERLGVLVDDALSELGELLVVAGGADEELAGRCADLLPDVTGLLVLQSDLTAVVSGQSSAAASRLLTAAAVPESRGVAATWRFTPGSVRSALDAGWTAAELRAELAAISERELPQPLDYLIGDVARRHGSVRVRGARCCVVGAEPEISEILHTRALAKLHLTWLAPTVLASPFEIDQVLARLRDAGFAPMPEDADGVVIVPERPDRAADGRDGRVPRPQLTAAGYAARLRAHPEGWTAPRRSATGQQLAALTRELTDVEVDLLADALDNGTDVSIIYRDPNGGRTAREIAPQELYGHWLDAWCYLRSGQQEFTVANIEAVAPVG